MYSTQSFDLIFCRFSRLLSPPFRVNMVTTKGKKPEITDALSRGRMLPEANGYADIGFEELEHTMAKTWKVKALTVTGTATERVENGIHIYDPGKQEWLVIKEFDDFEKAENWMTDYIRKNHFYYGDFKITR